MIVMLKMKQTNKQKISLGFNSVPKQYITDAVKSLAWPISAAVSPQNVWGYYQDCYQDVIILLGCSLRKKIGGKVLAVSTYL